MEMRGLVGGSWRIEVGGWNADETDGADEGGLFWTPPGLRPSYLRRECLSSVEAQEEG